LWYPELTSTGAKLRKSQGPNTPRLRVVEEDLDSDEEIDEQYTQFPYLAGG